MLDNANLNKLCLRLNDFLGTINTAFKDLIKDSDYTDVTLTCEDGHQIEAHKVILTAFSPFFNELLSHSGDNILSTSAFDLPKLELLRDMSELDEKNQEDDGSK